MSKTTARNVKQNGKSPKIGVSLSRNGGSVSFKLKESQVRNLLPMRQIRKRLLQIGPKKQTCPPSPLFWLKLVGEVMLTGSADRTPGNSSGFVSAMLLNWSVGGG